MNRLTLLGLGAMSSWLVAAEDIKRTIQAYPGAEKPSCLAQPTVKESSDAFKRGADQAQIALKKSFESPDGIWNQEVLKNKPTLKQALEDFMKGERGQSVKNLKLTDKTPQDIHTALLAAGFTHERRPLSAWNTDKKSKERKYWRRDGTQTGDAKDSQIIPLDIYTHRDGGVVRVKPEGVPSLKHPHPEPEASKAVLFKAALVKEGAVEGKTAGTKPAEAFNVSEDGIPLPKGVGVQTGMRFIIDRLEIPKMTNPQGARQELKGWTTTIMRAAYFPLAADFSQCPKQEMQDSKNVEKSS